MRARNSRGRFGDVIVGAEVQSHDFLGLVRSRREKKDRSRDPDFPDLAADLESVLARKHDVKQNEVDAGIFSPACSGQAIVRDLYFESL